MASLQAGRSRGDVEAILSRLEAGLETNDISISECDEMLTSLHFHTRTIRNPATDPLTTKKGMTVVAGYGFDNTNVPANTRRIALRCLNNILALEEPMRQVFVDENYPHKVIEVLKAGDPDDELAACSLLVLSSAKTKLDLAPYFESHDLAGIINANITRHAKTNTPLSTDPTQPCVATLKLLASLGVLCEAHAYRFIPSLQPILDLLLKVSIPSPPLEIPVQPLIMCLAAIPFHEGSKEDADINPFSVPVVDKLLDVLEESLKVYTDQMSEMSILPLMLTLTRIAQSAEAESEVYSRLQSRLLPTDEDRKHPLGRGTTLPHRVVKLGTNALAPQLRDCTLLMVFELSHKDPTQFVNNVGFGNAAGYLAANGITLSQEDLQRGNASAAAGGSAINPITGQRLDSEPEVDMPEMTMEEKEREAERLFVLFERLRATGVVNVQNPAAQASSSHVVEELDSSDDGA